MTQHTFYPTVRQGYKPDTAFERDATTVGDASGLTVDVDVTGSPAGAAETKTKSLDLQLYGPGEVTGIDNRQIVRREPSPNSTAFPPNYFPLVEFDRPDLPWLFSPEAADDAGRVRPWCCLIAVDRDADGVEFTPAGTGPLPTLTAPATELPDPRETWAWAHAQLVGSTSDEIAELEADEGRKTVSRLLCPRNLTPNTRYRACVVPTFAPGKRAGKGQDPYPNGRGTLAFAWAAGSEATVELPVYAEWTFTSAPAGDFESLARELTPRQLPPTVGFRNIDVSRPGPASLALPADEANDIGTVGLGGALKSPAATADSYDSEAAQHLRELLNRPNDVERATDFEAVGPPLYGEWHAGIGRLEAEPPHADSDEYYYPRWFNQLNTDPRHRVAAGFGTAVIRENQEALMASAWEQFGEIREANALLRQSELAAAAQQTSFESMAALDTARLLGVTAPIHRQVFTDRGTVDAALAAGGLPDALVDQGFRRTVRPSGPLARRTGVQIDGDLARNLREGIGPVTGGNRLDEGDNRTAGDGPLFDFDGTNAGGGTDGPAGSEGVGFDQSAGTPAFESGVLGLAQGIDPEILAGAANEAGTSPEMVMKSMSYSGDSGGSFDAEDADDDSWGGPAADRARAALEGVEGHCLTAERAVTELATAVTRDDRSRVAELASDSPTAADHCASIDRNAIGPLARALAKTLVEPRADSVAPGLTQAAVDDAVSSLRTDARAATKLAQSAITDVRTGETTPATVERQLDRAASRLESALTTVDSLTGYLQPPRGDASLGPMQPMSDEDDRMGPSSPTQPLALTDASVGIDADALADVRETVLSELDPVSRLAASAADRLTLPGLLKRADPVKEIMAAPSFTRPLYERLADYDQEAFLPGVGEIQKNTVGVLSTNPVFVESFLAGANHELARELRWRRFPTDRRGSYCRWFWDRSGNPQVGEEPADLADVEPLHTWDENPLGENGTDDDEGADVVVLLRGELLRRYPNTSVYAAKAVEDDGDRVPALPGSHVTRGDATSNDDLKFPVFRGQLDPDITFFGFDLGVEEALYDPYDETDEEPDDHPDEGWFFVLEEPPGETRFGLDVNQSDVGTTPPGITAGGETTQVDWETAAEGDPEHGWAALSWGHLVGEDGDPASETHVRVDDHRPGAENWSVDAGTDWADMNTKPPASQLPETAPDDNHFELTATDAATWGYNSAHMARATWQRPVRVAYHADDMLPEGSNRGAGGDADLLGTVEESLATAASRGLLDADDEAQQQLVDAATGGASSVDFDTIRTLEENFDTGGETE